MKRDFVSTHTTSSLGSNIISRNSAEIFFSVATERQVGELTLMVDVKKKKKMSGIPAYVGYQTLLSPLPVSGRNVRKCSRCFLELRKKLSPFGRLKSRAVFRRVDVDDGGVVAATFGFPPSAAVLISGREAQRSSAGATRWTGVAAPRW